MSASAGRLSRRRMMSLAAAGIVLGASASARAAPASLQLPADADAVVEVSTGSVDLVFEGTEHPRVEILDARLPAGWNVTLEGGGARVRIVFEGVGVPSSGQVRIGVPRGCELRVRGIGSSVSATSFNGDATVTTVNGGIEISGTPNRTLLTTTSGDVKLSGVRDEAEVTTVNGRIEVVDARGVLRINGVSGDVRVRKSKPKRTSVATVSGDIDFEATLVDGPHELDTHAGHTTVRLDPQRPLHVRARSFSGAIEDKLVEPSVQTRSRYEREQGDNPPRLELSSFSGGIELIPT